MRLNDFDSGYLIGWDEGRYQGIDEGYSRAVNDYEPRIAKLWAELQTLNARIDYLSKVLDGKTGESK